MKSILMMTVAASALMLAACGEKAETPAGADKAAVAASNKPELGSFGIDLTAAKDSVAAGKDFFEHANGSWLETFEIPADRSSYGAFTVLADRSEERVKAIIDDLAAIDAAKGSVDQLVGDLFKSWMDVDAVNAKGIAPLMPVLEKIGAISTKSELVKAFGHARWDSSISPISTGVGINRLNPDEHELQIGASGLGLPDRDYYLEDSERFETIRTAYKENIVTMLGFAGVEEAAAKEQAEAILALETKIASHHWPRAERRNRDKTLNQMTYEELKTNYPFDWDNFFEGFGAQVANLNVAHPSAVKSLTALIDSEDLATWKAYLTYHSISNNATLLSEDIDQANFDFYGKVLRGQTEQRERWKRGVALVGSNNAGLGEAVGRIYVERYFPEDAKAQVKGLVENLRTALGARIESLDWMGDETKAKALEKLAAFNPKIGYPDKWRDYDGLEVTAGDLYANSVSLRNYFLREDLADLNEPTDKDQWFMSPQTVNAYYNPQFNEIVFPAAILQPPFFDPYADAAVNYGGIGAVIGHEMGHGFDDQGSKSNAKGVQANWWTEEDRANFEALADKLVAQYNSYEALPDAFVDGRFTLGENIGDVGGLSMAYHAYKLSLGGKEAPVIDGLTGDQRFFLAWAQVWKRKDRDESLLSRLKSDPHSPSEFRVNGVVRNMDAWYDAFGVTKDDEMYLPEEERVTIW